MSFLSQATPAPKPKTRNAWLAGMLLAAFLILMAVGQLFSFEDFPAVVEAMWLPGGQAAATIAAAVLVTLEVLALPFLLGLRLSVLMRVLSMLFGWLVIVAWIVLFIGNMLQGAAVNSGLLGATVILPIGWWAVFFGIALAVLAAWAAWGMWPLKQRRK